MTPLALALDDLATRGRSTPCQIDPAPFTSDRPAERREAAEACAPCPILDACRDSADTLRESWHVWGGRDRTPTTTRRKKP